MYNASSSPGLLVHPKLKPLPLLLQSEKWCRECFLLYFCCCYYYVPAPFEVKNDRGRISSYANDSMGRVVSFYCLVEPTPRVVAKL